MDGKYTFYGGQMLFETENVSNRRSVSTPQIITTSCEGMNNGGKINKTREKLKD